jgi:bifunctional ADP-heptose synthase (sugar kinase/adenylyltransferase)
MLASVGMTLAAGGGAFEAACLGSIASAIQVGRLGNTPLTLDSLKNVIKT